VKAADIVVGQDYVYGTKTRWNTYRRCRVLEIGKHQVLDDSDAVVPAALIIMAGDEGSQWVVLRSIVMPWAEHEAAEARKQKARQEQALRGPERAERARLAIKQLAEIGLDTGTPNFELVDDFANGLVRVRVEFLEDVLEALA
jgi:hypothetical protein